MITLNVREENKLRKLLYDKLDVLSEYHEELTPEEDSDLSWLLEAYFYWAEQHNDKCLPEEHRIPRDNLDLYVIQQWKHYEGED